MPDGVENHRERIVEYRRPLASVSKLDIRREGPDLTILIPSPVLWKAIFARGIPCGLFFFSAGVSAILAWETRSVTGPLVAMSLLASGAWAAAGVWQMLKLIVAARYANTPSILSASAGGLSIRVPSLRRRGQRHWNRAEITDISLRQRGFMPGLLCHIRMQVVLEEDRVSEINIPARGTEPLAVIEDNLRDALGMKLVA